MSLALSQHTSLFADILGEDIDGPASDAGPGADEDAASAVARQIAVCCEPPMSTVWVLSTVWVQRLSFSLSACSCQGLHVSRACHWFALTAVELVQDLLENPSTQHSMVAAHAEVVQHLVTSAGLQLHVSTWSHGMKHSEPFATAVADSLTCTANQVMESCGGYMTADFNTAAIGGIARQLVSRLASLYPRSSPDVRGVLDVTSPCLEEKTLAVATVSKLHKHIQQLLERFPEQPVLEQLLKICDRILGAQFVHCQRAVRAIMRIHLKNAAAAELSDDEMTADFLLISVTILSIPYLSCLTAPQLHFTTVARVCRLVHWRSQC